MIVLDTHALVWWLGASPQLSARAAAAIRRALSASKVVASTISIFEIATAARRGRLALALPLDQWLSDAQSLPELNLVPVSAEIATTAGTLGEDFHGDPADRIIAATALVLGVSLISADEKMRSSARLKTVW